MKKIKKKKRENSALLLGRIYVHVCWRLLQRSTIVKRDMKYFYCDDNNVYTMIKYYDLYHNDCNIKTIQRFIRGKKLRRKTEVSIPPTTLYVS